jgi:CubicO group peptidase (beta-lactamase class C family)
MNVHCPEFGFSRAPQPKDFMAPAHKVLSQSSAHVTAADNQNAHSGVSYSELRLAKGDDFCHASSMNRACSFWLLAAVFALHTAHADRVDSYLKTEMAKHQIPGLALTIVQNGKAVKTATYGLANIELKAPVKPETAFEIGSITKQFTAAGILLLAQDGKLSVDDRLSRYLPGTPESWGSITLRHLLTHTSGIMSYTGLDGFELRRHLTQAQFIAAIGTQPLEFAPGASWKYCNTGFSLLGYVIENVSGKSYWVFMNDRIFRPLGMTTTTNRLPALVIPNRASGYEQTNHILINRDYDLTDVFSAGALVSTVGDLAKWDTALDCENLLTAKTKEQMWTPARLTNDKPTRYGFGWFIDSQDGRRNIWHSGSTSGFSASIQRFPDDKLAVIVLSNTDEQIATTLAKGVAALYFKKPGRQITAESN